MPEEPTMAENTTQASTRASTLPTGATPQPAQRSLNRTQSAGPQPVAAKPAKAAAAAAPVAATTKNNAPSAPSAAGTPEGTTTMTTATTTEAAPVLTPGMIDPVTGKKVRKKREPRTPKTTKVGELELTQSELATLGGIYVNSEIAGLTPAQYIAKKKKQGFEEIMLWDRLYPPAVVAASEETSVASDDSANEEN